MWSAVAPDDVGGKAPSARSKHSATVVGEHVYLIGGRNGNLPLKDFWKYSLDDEFTLEYIRDAIANGFLSEHGITVTDITDLNIERVSADLIWNSRGKTTKRDEEATEVFLRLRLENDPLFRDKKTCENTIWQDIAQEMQARGYVIDPNLKTAREKCRQKFQNLSRGYIQFVNHINATGREHKEPPEHYDILHDLLGNKHKVHPTQLNDSMEETSSQPHEYTSSIVDLTPEDDQNTNGNTSPSIPSDAIPGPSKPTVADTNTAENRFRKVKNSVRPPKQNLAELMQTINDENNRSFNEQFNMLLGAFKEQNELLREQNQQRSELTQILKNDSSKKKRKRARSSSASD